MRYLKTQPLTCQQPTYLPECQVTNHSFPWESSVVGLVGAGASILALGTVSYPEPYSPDPLSVPTGTQHTRVVLNFCGTIKHFGNLIKTRGPLSRKNVCTHAHSLYIYLASLQT